MRGVHWLGCGVASHQDALGPQGGEKVNVKGGEIETQMSCLIVVVLGVGEGRPYQRERERGRERERRNEETGKGEQGRSLSEGEGERMRLWRPRNKGGRRRGVQ